MMRCRVFPYSNGTSYSLLFVGVFALPDVVCKEINMKRFLVLAAVLFLLSAHLVNAQDTPSRIDALMSEYESLAFHGAVLVSVNGEVIYSKAFGFANREWSIPNTTETRFRIGSLTKAFTAALVLRLVEEQILDLHEPITTYLPNYPNPKGGDITLHHLLTHTSGIPSYSEFPEFGTEIAPNPISAKILISLFSERELEFEPGSDRTYSNSGYALAGYIVNKATGMSYAEAMDKWVLIPLGLNDTGVPMEDFTRLLIGIRRWPTPLEPCIRHWMISTTGWCH
jgi:CubicO group peptidase (beta-lactamase class C family)